MTKANGSIDLFDIIAQRSIEVGRLGWTADQDKQYLKQAYGKESHQLLSPDELIGFLNDLKSQNSTEKSSKSTLSRFSYGYQEITGNP